MKMKSWIGMGSVAALGLAVSAFISLPAFANGGDFFNELSESWGANSDTGVPFFGWVRDSKGKAIPRAIVTASPRLTTVFPSPAIELHTATISEAKPIPARV